VFGVEEGRVLVMVGFVGRGGAKGCRCEKLMEEEKVGSQESNKDVHWNCAIHIALQKLSGR
jgi:hypothetical protein